MTDPNEPIYPEKDWANVPTFGLTKREYFSAIIMSGLVINDNPDMSYEKYAEYSIRYADALIKKLNKQL